jgi:hypothetical protein
MIAGAEPGRSSGPVGSVAEADIRPVKVDQAMLDAAADAAGLTREQVQVLQATLYELSEIKRIVDESGD